MSEEQQIQGQDTETAVTPPAGAQNTEASPSEHMIPKSRFDEVNTKMREFEKKLAKYEKAEKDKAEQDALSRGEYEKVINEIRPKAERADTLEATLADYLKIELESIPEKFRALVPDGDVVQKLKWINEAKKSGVFTSEKPAPPGKLDAESGSASGASSGQAVSLPTVQSQLAAEAQRLGFKIDTEKLAERIRQAKRGIVKSNTED